MRTESASGRSQPVATMRTFVPSVVYGSLSVAEKFERHISNTLRGRAERGSESRRVVSIGPTSTAVGPAEAATLAGLKMPCVEVPGMAFRIQLLHVNGVFADFVHEGP